MRCAKNLPPPAGGVSVLRTLAGFIAHDTAFPTARGKFPGFNGIRIFRAFRHRLRHSSFQPGNPLFVVGENAAQLVAHGCHALRDTLQIMAHTL